MKRFLLSAVFLILAAVLILPQNVDAAEADVTVYVDCVNGASDNDGLTEQTAVSTVKQGYAALKTAMVSKGLGSSTTAVGKIVIVNNYRFEEFTTSSKTKDAGTDVHNYRVILTGKTPDTVLEFYLPAQCTYGLRGPTTIENICIRIAEDSQPQILTITGHSGTFIIGQGVTTSDTPALRPCLTAAPYFTTTKSVSLEVNSGQWRNLYAGVYTSTATSNPRLIMNGGFADKIGSSYNGTINGSVTIDINGGTVAELVTGPINSGKINGNVTVNINGGSITRSVHPTPSGTISGTLTTNLSPSLGVTLQNTGIVTVNNLTSGNLNLGTGASLVVTDSVTGPVRVSVPTDISYGTYITAPVSTSDDALEISGGTLEIVTSDTEKSWMCTDLSTLKGLVLQSPSGVTVNLYTGLAKGATTKITPDFTKTENGIDSRYYPNLAVGSYHYVASGTGYYTVDKDIYFSAEKVDTKTVINADPGKKSGKYYEATTTIYSPTDEFMDSVIPSDVSMWPEYSAALTTPMLSETSRAAQAYTSYDEMIAVLEGLVAENGNMYLYYLGKTHKYDIDIPLVIFTETDLSGARTLEEAAALVVANEKLTVHYQGLMHGNEPAGGEGALAVTKLLATDYGDALTDTMNIYVIPWLSPAGARDDRRMIPGTNIDPNRDMLRVETTEIQLHHYAYELFQPEVSMDSHEFTVDPSYDTTNYNDMMLAAGFTSNNSQDFIDLSTHLTTLPFAKLRQQGLRPTYYVSEVNFNNPNNGSSYAGNRGILYVLIESRGIYGGHDAYARRTVGHVITATEVLKYVHENVEAVQKTVDAEKARIATLGATYEDSDLIVLEHGPVEHPELSYTVPRFDGTTGAWKYDTNTVPKAQEQILRSRVKPTAYVIPAEEAWTNAVLDRLDKHFVEYTFIPAGQSILLQQYGGTASEATLSQEQFFHFKNGAYVVTLDTYYANVIATMFEPDVTDSAEYKGTLVQSGLIPAAGDTYPIYRYIHDLNDDGSITTFTPAAAPSGLTGVNPVYIGGTGAITGLDPTVSYEYRSSADAAYTPVSAGASAIENLQIGTYYIRYASPDGVPSAEAMIVLSYVDIKECTVYLCSATGSDDNAGYLESNPVATMEKAFSQLDLFMQTAASNCTGKIVLLSDYALGNAAYTFPKHSYHVTLTAKNASTQITKGGTATQATCSINLSGPMTIDHITLTLVSNSGFNNFNANGHQVTFGKDILCKANSSGTYFMLAGGGWNEVASTDLTVLGGTWEYIYSGGYTGSVKGDAKLVMKDAQVCQQMMANYNATSIGGSVYFDLENVTAPVLYGAMAKNKDSSTKSTIHGDIYITLGEGVSIPTIYAGSRDSGNVSGTVTIILDGADLTGCQLIGKAKNSTGTVGGSALVLKNGTLGKISNFGSVTLGTTGYVKLSEAVATDMIVLGDSYLDLNGKVLTGNLTGTGTLFGMDSSSDTYELPTGAVKGTVSCNLSAHFKSDITGQIKRYMSIAEDTGYTFHRFYVGITKLSLRTGETGFGYKARFCADPAVQALVESFGFTLQLDGMDTVVTESLPGSQLDSNKEYSLLLQNFDVKTHGQTAVNAEVFLKLKDNTTITSTSCSYSLKNMVEKLNTVFETLEQTKQAALVSFIAAFVDTMKDWAIGNIK